MKGNDNEEKSRSKETRKEEKKGWKREEGEMVERKKGR